MLCKSRNYTKGGRAAINHSLVTFVAISWFQPQSWQIYPSDRKVLKVLKHPNKLKCCKTLIIWSYLTNSHIINYYPIWLKFMSYFEMEQRVIKIKTFPRPKAVGSNVLFCLCNHPKNTQTASLCHNHLQPPNVHQQSWTFSHILIVWKPDVTSEEESNSPRSRKTLCSLRSSYIGDLGVSCGSRGRKVPDSEL